MWILILYMAGANPAVFDFGYFLTKADCYQVAEEIEKNYEQTRDTFCILGAEKWHHAVLKRRPDEYH